MTKKILLTVATVAVAAVGAQAQIVYAQAGESITISSLTDASAQGGVTYEWFCNGTRIVNCTEASCAIPVNMATGTDVRFQRRATALGCAVGNSANANTMTITFCNLVENGVCWADANLSGWRTFATQADEYTPFFQYNRTKEWPAEGTNVSGWNSTISENEEWHADSSPCPEGWRLPTRDEYVALDGNSNPGGGVWAATSANRGNTVNGRFYGKRAGECTYPNDMVGCLFIPASGYRTNTTGALSSKDVLGFGWSSTQSNNNASAYMLRIRNVDSNPLYTNAKALGLPVRCVR